MVRWGEGYGTEGGMMGTGAEGSDKDPHKELWLVLSWEEYKRGV